MTSPAVYTYAQLEGLWQQTAQGTRYDSQSWAALMAAIAEAESGGNPNAQNPSGASGLWQILGNPFPGNAFDPATNAKMALAKLENPKGLSNWATYDSGAYKAYLNGSTTPDTTFGGNPVLTAAQSQADTASDCLMTNPFGGGIAGAITGGPTCLFTKSNARAWIGAGLLAAGGLIALPGLRILLAGTPIPVSKKELDKVPVVGVVSQKIGGKSSAKVRQPAPRRNALKFR